MEAILQYSILSNAEEFAEIAKDFIKRNVPLQMMP